MKIEQRVIAHYDSGSMCNFCNKEATDEVVMNGRTLWFLCSTHKQNFDMMLAFQDLIHS